MIETRKKLGMNFALGKTKYYKHHYNEFKEEIDKELGKKEEVVEKDISKKSKKEN